MEVNSPSCGSSFACNGQYFALISIDNRLRIWETTSGKLVQEFSPSADIESSCTCLCWTREHTSGFDGSIFHGRNKDAKKRKRKLKDENTNNFPSIILGTKGGKLLLYSPLAGEAQGIYNDGHSDSVNCVCFHDSDEKVYSCSKDRCIVEWSYNKKDVLCKWKADKNCVNMICIGPSGKSLLSAGMSIKLWNLESKELMMKFNGHSSPISLLQFSDFRGKSKNAEYDDGYYFLSGSKEDRVVNAWNVNLSKPEKSPIAAYMLSDAPRFMNSAVVENSEKPLQLVVGCKDGKIYYFTSILNGKTNRPIEHSKQLEVLQREDGEKNTIPSKYLNGHLKIENGLTLKCVSGPYILPSFGEYNLTKMDSVTTVVNEVSKNLLLKKVATESNHTTDLAKMRNNACVIRNTLPNLSKNITLDVNGNEESGKRLVNNKESIKSDASMEERIQDMHLLSSAHMSSQKTPNAASFSQMLIQGLHTGDYSMVSGLLGNPLHDENVIFNTVERIPLKLITKLLQFIVDELNKSPLRSKSMGQWIRTILSVHFTHLSSSANNEVNNTLRTLFATLKSHEEIYTKLIKLQGKMDLLISYVDKTCGKAQGEEVVTKSAIVFNDDSDDDALFDEMEDDKDVVDEEEETDQDNDDGESETEEEDVSSDNDDEADD